MAPAGSTPWLSTGSLKSPPSSAFLSGRISPIGGSGGFRSDKFVVTFRRPATPSPPAAGRRLWTWAHICPSNPGTPWNLLGGLGGEGGGFREGPIVGAGRLPRYPPIAPFDAPHNRTPLLATPGPKGSRNSCRWARVIRVKVRAVVPPSKPLKCELHPRPNLARRQVPEFQSFPYPGPRQEEVAQHPRILKILGIRHGRVFILPSPEGREPRFRRPTCPRSPPPPPAVTMPPAIFPLCPLKEFRQSSLIHRRPPKEPPSLRPPNPWCTRARTPPPHAFHHSDHVRHLRPMTPLLVARNPSAFSPRVSVTRMDAASPTRRNANQDKHTRATRSPQSSPPPPAQHHCVSTSKTHSSS